MIKLIESLKGLEVDTDTLIIVGVIAITFIYMDLELAQTAVTGLFAFMGLKTRPKP